MLAMVTNFSWDFDNRWSSATTGSTTVSHKYDALGRRVAHTVGSTTTVFVQAGQQTIADYASGAAPASSTYRYIYASYIDEPVMRWQTSNSTPVYYHRTQQYSITAITSSTGAVVERYAYSAYGAPTIANASGTVLTASAYNNRYTYTGREWDNDIQQYHYRARMYDASLGRFCSRDPIGYVDGYCLYRAYWGLRGLDPFGTHLHVTPRTAPENQPWTSTALPPGYFGRTSIKTFDIDCPCRECKKCKGFYVGHCSIDLELTVEIDEKQAKNAPPPNPLPSGYKEPDWTYGHEQRHVENIVNEAKAIMDSLDKARRTCSTKDECELSALKLIVEATERMLKFAKDEGAHLHSPFAGGNEGSGFPPIGTMPNATK
jgi:RHS repeat-associated protein